jgi:hypothetical protein
VHGSVVLSVPVSSAMNPPMARLRSEAKIIRESFIVEV